MDELIYFDSYILQQDLRIRLPKAVLSNVGATKGETQFDIFLNPTDRSIVLKVKADRSKNE